MSISLQKINWQGAEIWRSFGNFAHACFRMEQNKAKQPSKKAQVRFWAAFTLSKAWRSVENFLLINFFKGSSFRPNIESLSKAEKILTKKRLTAMSQVIEDASSVKVDTATLAESMSKVEVLADTVPVVKSSVMLETVDMAVFTDLENELEDWEARSSARECRSAGRSRWQRGARSGFSDFATNLIFKFEKSEKIKTTLIGFNSSKISSRRISYEKSS